MAVTKNRKALRLRPGALRVASVLHDVSVSGPANRDDQTRYPPPPQPNPPPPGTGGSGTGTPPPGSIPPGTITHIGADEVSVGLVTDNMIFNPTFENNLHGWGVLYGIADGAANDPIWAAATGVSGTPEGDNVLKISNNGTFVGARAVPVVSGAKYAVRCRVLASAATGTWYLRMYERTSRPAKDYVTHTLKTSSTDLVSGAVPPSSWTLQEFVYTVPAGVTWVSFSVSNWTGSQTLYICEAEFRKQIRNIHVDGIDAAKITSGVITTTRLNLADILLDPAGTWTDNSPGAGQVAWAGHTVYYKGTSYAITDGNTSNKYIYWTNGSSTFSTSAGRPTLGDNDFLIATNGVGQNAAGTHDLTWNAVGAGSVRPLTLDFDALAQLFMFGDGNDGAVTISGNTTLTRDMAYDTLTVNNGVNLDTAGYRIFCKTSCTNNGTIRNNGNVGAAGAGGVGGAGGAALAAGTLGGSGSGGTGGNGGPPTDGGQAGNAATGGCQLGGGGGSGGNGGAAGGSVTVGPNLPRFGFALVSHSANIRGGSGGGGGRQSGSGFACGGGGSGGGVVVISAKTITNNGTISANGGQGGNNEGGTSGGGGGGGGGGAVLIYRTFSGSDPVANGGAGAAIGGGNAGASGTVLKLQQEA